MIMTTSVKVKFRASRVPGKAGSIYYQVTHDRQVRRITTRIRIVPEWWDAEAGQVLALPGEASVVRHRIDGDIVLLQRIVRDLTQQGRPYTADEIVSRFRTPHRDATVLAFLRSQIARLTSEGRLGTARNYQRTYRSFSDFLGGADMDAVVRHIEHLLDLGGAETLALGGDLDGCDTLGGGVTGIQDYPKLYAALAARGYDEPLLSALSSGNWLRVLPKE